MVAATARSRITDVAANTVASVPGPIHFAHAGWAFVDIADARIVLDDVLAGSDVVVLAAPATSETRGMMNERTLGLMKPSAVLVNVARGDLIDSEALLSALDRGLLSAVGLDVTDPEPLPDGHPLWSCPQLLISPHVGGPSTAMWPRAYRLMSEQLRRFAAGDPLLNVVPATRS